MKVRVQLSLGILLSFASTPVFAGMDGKQLFQEFSSEMAQYEAENQISDLMSRIRKTLESAEMRSIETLEYTITQHPDFFYDVTGLEKGQHPFHATGDWDCDGEEDQAVILKQPKTQIAVVLSSGMTLTFETGVDGITPGKPGRHLTAAAKVYGDGEGERAFTAKCGFINAEYWGKSSFALVVDLDGEKLVKHQTSD